MPPSYDLVCYSHLRWDFVFQRPQHLLTRFARQRRVFFVEEPVFDGVQPLLDVSPRADGLTVVTPHLSPEAAHRRHTTDVVTLLDLFFHDQAITDHVAWYYTPMALAWSAGRQPLATVYDCMDELSLFHGAPPELTARERELFARAALVFTGGQSLYEAKRAQHAAVHCFPSSVDLPHFAQARLAAVEPADQRPLPRPRLGFFGVIDERMDLDLLAGVADARPDWQLVLVGPVVKIDPATLPRRPNLHYLGGKDYADLPAYIGGWDVALLPFARNEATRFISPTKTPEYLAAGRPVVSTAIRDVARPYGERGLVRIADTVPAFVAACTAALTEERGARQAEADRYLAGMSWDATHGRMAALIEEAVAAAALAPARG